VLILALDTNVCIVKGKVTLVAQQHIVLDLAMKRERPPLAILRKPFNNLFENYKSAFISITEFNKEFVDVSIK
jgi:hypothetical protein